MYYVANSYKRLSAKVTDTILVGILYLPFFYHNLGDLSSGNEIVLHWSKVIILLIVPILYEVVFYLLFSATPGKIFNRLKLVPADNSSRELGALQIILRSLSTKFTVFFSWALYALALFTYDRTHFADWISNTRVVSLEGRAHRAKRKYILGTILCIYFFIDGLHGVKSLVKSISLDHGSVVIDRNIVANSFSDMGEEDEADD